MKNPKQLWVDLCNRFAQQSQCRSRQVGCIIVHNDTLIAEGWNSPPSGSCVTECKRCNLKRESGTYLEEAICAHAEINAISHCARRGIALDGASLYCTHFCCKYCASAIVRAGIKHFYYINEYPGYQEAQNILNNANVSVTKLS